MTTPIAASSPRPSGGWFWDSPACSPRWLTTPGAVEWSHPVHGPVRVRAAEILYARATPKRMTLLYRLELAAANRVWQDQLVVGVVVPPGRHVAERQARLAAARVETDPYPAVVSVPEADLVLVPYPNDLRLRIPTREDLAGALARHRSALCAALGTRGAEGPIDLEVLRYVPDKRWTARCCFGRSRRDGTRASVIVKLYPDADTARRAARTLDALHAGAGRETHGAMAVPRVIAVDVDLGIVMTQSLPGMDLERSLAEDRGTGRLALAAGALARFHEIEADPGRSSLSLGDCAIEVREAAQTALWAAPELGPRLARVAYALGSHRPRAAEKSSLIHGSFRMNHVLVHGDRLAMFDLDGARRGPCEYDLANFLSSLYYLEAEGRLDIALRRRVARIFLQGYVQSARRPVSAARTLWLMAGLLVEKQALKCATRPGDQRLRKTTRMVDWAERSLAAYEALSPRDRAADLWSMLP